MSHKDIYTLDQSATREGTILFNNKPQTKMQVFTRLSEQKAEIKRLRSVIHCIHDYVTNAECKL